MANTQMLPALPAKATQHRPGVFVILNGLLGIIAGLGKYSQTTVPTEVPDGESGVMKTVNVVRDVLDTLSPHATIHLVNPKSGQMLRATEEHAEPIPGAVLTDHGELRNVPLDTLQFAPWSNVVEMAKLRNKGDIAHLTPLTGYRMGYPLSEQEQAEAATQHAENEAKKAMDATLATNPEWQAHEAQLAKDAAALAKKQNAARDALKSKLLAT